MEAVETVEEMDDVVEEVEDNNNKASTIKQMQEIVLKVQVGFVWGSYIYTTISNQPTQCIQGEFGLDSKPIGEHPKCVQFQCNAFSNPGWICHHCPAHSCSIFSSSQVMFHLIS